jgi:hypothetical protein
MRWSNTGEMQPENFNPSNRWVPKTPANEILNMRQVGLYLMGFSQDRIYRIGRSGQFIRVEEGHIGYGLQARRGLETIGSMAYFVSGGGLKAISAEGQVDDVTALDNLINVTWQANKSELQLAFDAYGQCLTIMKPTTPGEYYADGRAAILWFGTNRITELVDLPFDFVVSGYVVPGPTSTVQRRALFVKWTSAEDVGVYMVDHERSNAPNPHNLCGGVADATAPNLVWSGDVPPSELSQEAYGCAVYNIRTGERLLANELYAELSAFPTGSIGQYFSVAPIVQQWVGGNIGMQIQPGQPEFKDFFRQKQISSCRAYYEVVSALADGQPDPTSALQCDANYPTGTAWRAIVLRGNETQEYATATPTLHPTNEVAPVFCIDNDCWPSKPAGSWPGLIPNASFGKHGTLWSTMSPGWKCWVSGVDLRLLAFSAVGRILDSDRRYT